MNKFLIRLFLFIGLVMFINNKYLLRYSFLDYVKLYAILSLIISLVIIISDYDDMKKVKKEWKTYLYSGFKFPLLIIYTIKHGF